MTIVRAEVRRIRSRRITKVAAIFALVIVVIAGGLTFRSHVDEAPDMVAAGRMAAEQEASCLEWAADPASGIPAHDAAAQCFADPSWFIEDTQFHITDVLAPSNSDMTWSDIEAQASQRGEIYTASSNGEAVAVSGKLAAASGFSGSLITDMVVLILIATMLGATYIGADWRSGVLESQLVRIPSRARLYGGKIAAIALIMSLATITFGGLFMLAMIPSAVWRGDFVNGTTGFWFEAAAVIGRAAALAAVMSAIGASLAMLARNTVAGVMVPLAALIAGGFLINTTGRWIPFVSLEGNMNAFIGRGDVPYLFIQRFDDGSVSGDQVLSHGPIMAGLLLAGAALAAFAVSGMTFARRDVS